MKQLFIVPNGVTYPANESTIDKLTNGQLGIYETSGGVPKATVAKVKTSEFILAYGRDNSQAITMVINSDADITKITATEGNIIQQILQFLLQKKVLTILSNLFVKV